MLSMEAIRARLAEVGPARFADLFCERRRGLRLEITEGRRLRRIEANEAGWGIRRVLGDRVEMECCEGSEGADGTEAGLEEEPCLQTFLDAMRQEVPDIAGVSAEWQCAHQIVRVANSTGAAAQDERRSCRLTLTLRLERQGRRAVVPMALPWPETGGEVASIRRRVVAEFESRDLPDGDYDIILSPGSGAVFFHETVGHALEADAVASWARKGERVASEFVTVVDDGTLAGGPGSLAVTDEGFPTRRAALIERGRIAGRITDYLHGMKESMLPSGGRRESFRCPPQPRMTNLLVEAREDGGRLDDVIGETRRGVLAIELVAGRVDLDRGEFSFYVPHGYLIEEGRAGRPVSGLIMSGRILETLSRIDRVGGDFEMARTASYCVKAGQTVQVGLGQPTVRIRRVRVSQVPGRTP